jgi:hypothetical protein
MYRKQGPTSDLNVRTPAGAVVLPNVAFIVIRTVLYFSESSADRQSDVLWKSDVFEELRANLERYHLPVIVV